MNLAKSWTSIWENNLDLEGYLNIQILVKQYRKFHYKIRGLHNPFSFMVRILIPGKMVFILIVCPSCTHLHSGGKEINPDQPITNANISRACPGRSFTEQFTPSHSKQSLCISVDIIQINTLIHNKILHQSWLLCCHTIWKGLIQMNIYNLGNCYGGKLHSWHRTFCSTQAMGNIT